MKLLWMGESLMKVDSEEVKKVGTPVEVKLFKSASGDSIILWRIQEDSEWECRVIFKHPKNVLFADIGTNATEEEHWEDWPEGYFKHWQELAQRVIDRDPMVGSSSTITNKASEYTYLWDLAS